jgi:hypothetical protein
MIVQQFVVRGFVNVLWSIDSFMCGSVDIAAIPSPLCVAEMCNFVMHVMIETVNVVEDVGEGKLCLPLMLVKVVCIQNSKDSTHTAMESLLMANKFITVSRRLCTITSWFKKLHCQSEQ